MPDLFGRDAASAADLLYTGGPNEVSTEHAVPLSHSANARANAVPERRHACTTEIVPAIWDDDPSIDENTTRRHQRTGQPDHRPHRRSCIRQARRRRRPRSRNQPAPTDAVPAFLVYARAVVAVVPDARR